MIMSGPDIPTHKEITTPVQLLDGFSTILEVTGTEIIDEDRELLGLFGMITTFSLITSQFVANGGFVPSQALTDFRGVMIGFQKSGNLVSFVLAELDEGSHQCLSFFQG